MIEQDTIIAAEGGMGMGLVWLLVIVMILHFSMMSKEIRINKINIEYQKRRREAYKTLYGRVAFDTRTTGIRSRSLEYGKHYLSLLQAARKEQDAKEAAEKNALQESGEEKG